MSSALTPRAWGAIARSLWGYSPVDSKKWKKMDRDRSLVAPLSQMAETLLLFLIRDKSTKDCLDKRQKAFWPRSILQMHGRRLACLNDFPRYLQVGFESEPSPDEDMIDGSLRKPRPHIFHTFPEKHLQTLARELLLCVGQDVVRDSQ